MRFSTLLLSGATVGMTTLAFAIAAPASAQQYYGHKHYAHYAHYRHHHAEGRQIVIHAPPEAAPAPVQPQVYAFTPVTAVGNVVGGAGYAVGGVFTGAGMIVEGIVGGVLGGVSALFGGPAGYAYGAPFAAPFNTAGTVAAAPFQVVGGAFGAPAPTH
jgi:hypothetical protein